MTTTAEEATMSNPPACGPSAAVAEFIPPTDVKAGDLVLVGVGDALRPVARTSQYEAGDVRYVTIVAENPAAPDGKWVADVRADRLVAVQRYVTGVAALAHTLTAADWATIAAALEDAAGGREDRAGQSCTDCGERASTGGGLCPDCANDLAVASDYRDMAEKLTGIRERVHVTWADWQAGNGHAATEVEYGDWLFVFDPDPNAVTPWVVFHSPETAPEAPAWSIGDEATPEACRTFVDSGEALAVLEAFRAAGEPT